MQQSTISLRRESTFSSSLVGFKVFIDDAPVGVIRSGKEKSFPVQPGQHSVQLRFLWCRSDPRTVEVAPGATATLTCSAPRNPFVAMVAPYVFPRRAFEWK